MIKCPNCGELIRYDSKKCFVCNYELTEYDIKMLEEQHAEHERKLVLHNKLTIASDIIERVATLFIIIAMTLILPTIGEFSMHNYHMEGLEIIQEIRDEKKADLYSLDKNDPKYDELYAKAKKDYDRLTMRVEADERTGDKLLVKAILYAVVTGGTLVASIVLFIVRKLLLKKRKNLL